MPRIWYEDGFHFSFFAADGEEPPHVYVSKGGGRAKWWLDPIAQARSRGFNTAERSKIRRNVTDRRELLLAAWKKFFSRDSP